MAKPNGADVKRVAQAIDAASVSPDGVHRYRLRDLPASGEIVDLLMVAAARAAIIALATSGK